MAQSQVLKKIKKKKNKQTTKKTSTVESAGLSLTPSPPLWAARYPGKEEGFSFSPLPRLATVTLGDLSLPESSHF